MILDCKIFPIYIFRFVFAGSSSDEGGFIAPKENTNQIHRHTGRKPDALPTFIQPRNLQHQWDSPTSSPPFLTPSSSPDNRESQLCPQTDKKEKMSCKPSVTSLQSTTSSTSKASSTDKGDRMPSRDSSKHSSKRQKESAKVVNRTSPSMPQKPVTQRAGSPGSRAQSPPRRQHKSPAHSIHSPPSSVRSLTHTQRFHSPPRDSAPPRVSSPPAEDFLSSPASSPETEHKLPPPPPVKTSTAKLPFYASGPSPISSQTVINPSAKIIHSKLIRAPQAASFQSVEKKQTFLSSKSSEDSIIRRAVPAPVHNQVITVRNIVVDPSCANGSTSNNTQGSKEEVVAKILKDAPDFSQRSLRSEKESAGLAPLVSPEVSCHDLAGLTDQLSLTTLPAPIMANLPIVSPPMIVEFAPIDAPS